MSKLLRGPLCSWMGRNSKMCDPAAIMREHEKDEEQPEGCGRSHKEVSGNHLMHMVFQKCFPGLRGWSTRANHILGHSGFTNVDAKLEEFAMNVRRTPARIGQAHLSNEIANFAGFRRSSLACPALPSPVQTIGGRTTPRRHDQGPGLGSGAYG